MAKITHLSGGKNSVKQQFARRRNWQKARIMGMHIDTRVMTPKEQVIAKQINSLRKELIKNWTEGSIELGLNAKHRCWCGKPKKDDLKACSKEHEKFM